MKMKKLEKEFVEEVKKNNELINSKLEQINVLLQEAINISEETKTPFRADLYGNFVDRTYYPKGLTEKDLKKINHALFNEGEEIDLLEQELADFEYCEGIKTYDRPKQGWQYWSSSSLTC